MRRQRTLYDRLRAIYYAGFTFRCPFCGYRARDWSSVGWDFPVLKEKNVGGAGRRKAGCFNCGSNDRERLVHAYLEQQGLLENMHESRMLHIAPEVTLREFFLTKCKPRSYVIGDKKMPGYTYPPEVIDIDVMHLPFRDSSFEIVLCNHVLEHVPDDRKALLEIHRVLAPGGTAILQVPYAWGIEHTEEDPLVTSPEERVRRYGQFDHVRLYGQDYADRLRASGFEVRILLLGEDPAMRVRGLSAIEPLIEARRAMP